MTTAHAKPLTYVKDCIHHFVTFCQAYDVKFRNEMEMTLSFFLIRLHIYQYCTEEWGLILAFQIF